MSSHSLSVNADKILLKFGRIVSPPYTCNIILSFCLDRFFQQKLLSYLTYCNFGYDRPHESIGPRGYGNNFGSGISFLFFYLMINNDFSKTCISHLSCTYRDVQRSIIPDIGGQPGPAGDALPSCSTLVPK